MTESKSSALWWGIGIAVAVVLGMAVGLPLYLRHFVESNRAETPAISSLRTICSADISYQFGHAGFAPSLADLGAAKLIDPALAKGEKYGYRFIYLPVPDHGDKVEHFTVVARPVRREPGAMNSYLIDDTCKIRFTQEDRAPKPSDPEI